MTDCEELRQAVIEAKRVRNQAMIANAEAANRGLEAPHSDFDLMELRAAVHMAALHARDAGCDVDDLVGKNVGDRDSSL